MLRVRPWLVLGLVVLGLGLGGRWVLAPRETAVTEAIVAVARTGKDMPMFYVRLKDDKQKLAALTFDISWGRKTPPLVLEVLRQYRQQATFCLSGPWARRHPDLVQQIVADGHEICSHGDAHVNLSQYPASEVADNVRRAHADLVAATGQEPRFFRPPNGDYDDLVVATARELGYETLIWAVDSIDWKNPGVDYMVDRVLKLTFPGAVILLHASDSAKQTHQALPRVIEGLREAGWELVTVGRLLELGEPGRDDPR